MEGFTNQVKNYFKQIETLIKELHKTIINKNNGQIYISPFVVMNRKESIRIIGKGMVKEIILNGRNGGSWEGLKIRADNTIKINVPNTNFDFPKKPNDNTSSYLSIKENIRFNDFFSIYAEGDSKNVYGHIVYTLDE